MKDTRTNKGKDYEAAKWEEEVRKSLMTKKSAPAKLTKQQEALVKAQLGERRKIQAECQPDSCATCSWPAFYSEFSCSKHAGNSHLYVFKGALRRGSVLVGSTAFETDLVLILLISFISSI